MKYIILAVIGVLLIILWVIYAVRRNKAIRRVRCDRDEKKLKLVNDALAPFGFAFDIKQGIVISKNDAWQRDMGYTNFYDLNATAFHIVMDSEPIYFDYKNKEYRMEFFKGQYGITTGAEIGLYVREIDSDLPEGFYRSATDEERLIIGFELYKNCFLFARSGLSWWLTGFDVGKFCKPKDLKLKTCVRFPCEEMLRAFVKGLIKACYSENQIHVYGDCVCFELCCPKNYRLNHCHRFRKCFAQVFNRINCALFRHFTRYFNCTLDKLTFICYMAPCLYRIIVRFSMPRKKQCKKNRKRK